MKRKTELIKKAAVTVILLAIFMTSFAFGVSEEYTTENDPLVSLSYINGVLTPSLERYVDEKVKSVSVEEVVAALMKNDSFKDYVASVIAAQSGGSSGAASSTEFVSLTLSAGKRITANGKCEVIVRSGRAAAFCKTSGVIKDVSANKTLANGENVITGDLIEISYADNAGIAALQNSTEVLIRGEFTVGE